MKRATTACGLAVLVLCSVVNYATGATDQFLLVSSYWPDTVLRFDAASGAPLGAAVASGAGGLHLPEGLLVAPNNVLLVASVGFDRPSAIKKYDLITGNYLGDFTTAGPLLHPRGMAWGPDGNLYVCSDGTDEVLRYDAQNGDFIDAFVTAGAGGMDAPQDLEFRGESLYVSNHGTDTVLGFDAQTGALDGVFASSPSMTNPHGMTFGPDGNLYVVSGATNSVLRFDGQSGAFMDIFVTQGLGGLAGADNVLFGPQGHLYVSGYDSDGIHIYYGATGGFQGMLTGVTDPTYMLIIPEPATLSLLTLGGLALVRRRKRRACK